MTNIIREDYWNALIRQAEKGKFNLTLAIKGCPSLNEIDNPKLGLFIFDIIISKIKTMTPREFMQLFPVKKIYDGDRFGYKDYYYTIKAINEYGLDSKIEDPIKFIGSYQNDDVFRFLINYMNFVSEEYRNETGRSMACDWMEIAHIPYTSYSHDFMWITGYDGKETKITMPNVALWI